MDGRDISEADITSTPPRPHDYGVAVLQGAFTLWNQQSDGSITITASIRNLAIGRAAAPVFGSGILISGAGNHEGQVVVEQLQSQAVYSNGMIVPGTPRLPGPSPMVT